MLLESFASIFAPLHMGTACCSGAHSRLALISVTRAQFCNFSRHRLLHLWQYTSLVGIENNRKVGLLHINAVYLLARAQNWQKWQVARIDFVVGRLALKRAEFNVVTLHCWYSP